MSNLNSQQLGRNISSQSSQRLLRSQNREMNLNGSGEINESGEFSQENFEELKQEARISGASGNKDSRNIGQMVIEAESMNVIQGDDRNYNIQQMRQAGGTVQHHQITTQTRQVITQAENTPIQNLEHRHNMEIINNSRIRQSGHSNQEAEETSHQHTHQQSQRQSQQMSQQQVHQSQTHSHMEQKPQIISSSQQQSNIRTSHHQIQPPQGVRFTNNYQQQQNYPLTQIQTQPQYQNIQFNTSEQRSRPSTINFNPPQTDMRGTAYFNNTTGINTAGGTAHSIQGHQLSGRQQVSQSLIQQSQPRQQQTMKPQSVMMGYQYQQNSQRNLLSQQPQPLPNNYLRQTIGHTKQPIRQNYHMQNVSSIQQSRQEPVIRNYSHESVQRRSSTGHHYSPPVPAANVVRQPIQRNRNSVSYESRSSHSLAKPPVTFTYTSQNSIQALPAPRPSQQMIQYQPSHTHQVHVIRQQTVIQKTVTVVWQKRYYTIIQRFNWLYENFFTIIHQLQTIQNLLQNAKNQQEYLELKMKYTLLMEKLQHIQYQINQTKQENDGYVQQIKKQQSQTRTEDVLAKQRYKELFEELEKWKLRVTELEKENKGLQSKIGSYSDDYVKLDQQYHALEARLRQQSTQYIRYQETNNQLTAIISQLRLQLQQQQSRPQSSTSNLTVQIHKYTTIINQLENTLNEERNNFNRQREQFERDREQYKRNLQLVNQEYHNYQIETNKRIQIILAEHPQQSQGYYLSMGQNKIKQIIDNQNMTIATLQQRIQQLTLEINNRPISTTSNYQSQIAQFKSIISNQTEIINNLQGRTHPLNLHIKELEGTIRELERQIDNENKKQQQWNINYSKLERDNDELKARNNKLSDQISRVTTEQLNYQKRTQEYLISIQKQIQVKSEVQHPQQPRQPHIQDNSQYYEKQIEKLKNQIRIKVQQRNRYESQLISLEEQLKRMTMSKDSEIRLLNDRLQGLEQQLNRKISDRERNIAELQRQLQRLRKELQQYKSRPKTPTQQPQQYASPSNSSAAEVRQLKEHIEELQQEIRQLQRQKQERDKKISNFTNSINNLEGELNSKNQQLLSIKRQLANLAAMENEINLLSQSLQKKNQQILQYKSMTFEYNEIKVQVEGLKNERNNLKDTLKNKGKQIQHYERTVIQLNEKIRELSQSRPQSYSRPPPIQMDDSGQIQHLTDSVRRKQTQINKLKQSNQLKVTTIEELQYQTQKLKNKLGFQQRNLQHQKAEYQEKILYLEGRIKQLEIKLKSLDESQKFTSSNYQTEIQNLDIALKEREDIIRKLEGQIKILKNKLKGHDGKVQEYETDIESLNKRIKELQTEKAQLKRQLNGLQQSGKVDKNKLYDEFQIKIAELETAGTIKDKKIKHLENNLETMKLKITEINSPQRQNESQFINQQQIQVLRKKVAQYESRLFQTSSKVNTYKCRDYTSNYVFEQKVIYDLKTQNERLKKLLGDKGMYDTKFMIDQSPGGRTQGGSYNLQKRLYDFNRKLEDMIQQNRQLEEAGEFSNMEPFRNSFSYKQNEMVNSFERQRIALIQRHRRQIAAMQSWMIELQRYCASLQNPTGNSYSHTHIQRNSNNRASNVDKNIVNQQILYYREKNKQLEDRIDNHIKLNKQLKEKLEAYLKVCSDPNSIVFYKDQLTKYERQVSEYQDKIKQLTDNNRQLQTELQRLRANQSYESRAIELESMISELNRKISQLTMQNSLYQNDITRLNSEIESSKNQNTHSRKIQQQKSGKISSLQLTISRVTGEFEAKIAKLMNQLNIKQAQIERLNEALEHSSSAQEDQINKLRRQVQNLQQQIMKLQNKLISNQDSHHDYEEKINSYVMTINQLNVEINNLTNNYSSLLRKIQNLQSKIAESQNQINRLRAENAKLQKEKDQASSVYDDWKIKYNQLLTKYQEKCEQYDKINSLLEKLKMEREKQGNQSKQKLQYISQMQENVKKLKIELQRYKQARSKDNEQIEQLRNQIERLSSEINRLRGIIMEIQGEIQNYDAIKLDMSYKIEYIRSMFIKIDALVGQLQIKQDPSQSKIKSDIGEGINKSLQMCAEAITLLQ